MDSEGEVCAICLDPPTEGALILPCRHSYHAGCVLTSFSGETPGGWKCPCCRAPIVISRRSNKSLEKELNSKNKRHEESEYLNLPPGKHFYRPEESKWATLQAFISAAACAMADNCPSTTVHTITGHVDTLHASKVVSSAMRNISTRSNSPCHGKMFTNLQGVSAYSQGPFARCMAIAETVCPPTAASITALVGHAQLQRLLDPSLPHPAWKATRYLLAVLVTVGIVVLCIWLLRGIMYAAGVTVCSAADATSYAFGASPFEGVCVPMVPEGWILPLGFAAVGFYITVQIAWLGGVTMRHVLLKWDECALWAILVWFGVTLAYTFFVYFARFLLTVLVEVLGPFPTTCMSPSQSSLSDPC